MSRPSRAHLSLLAVALPLVIGCGAGADALEDVDTRHDALNPTYGVDYSWARPSPAHLQAEGYSFAARYLSDDAGKNISAGEADALRQAGLDIVVVWESSGTDVLGGYQAGAAHAQAAEAQATAAGMPAGRPIFFAVDFDAEPSQQGIINDYMDGVASVIGEARTGAYGGYSLIQRLFDDGKIAWGWQTYAWSYGQWDPRARLRQIQNGIEGGSCDKDEALAADFGQWGATGGGDQPPPPATLAEELAFQANTGDLWTVGSAGDTDWKLGMMAGTSPSIAALPGGGFEVAFQANTGDLWTVGSAGDTDWKLGMMAGTSPSIAALPGGGFEVAFQANTSDLWTVGSAGNKDWKLGMMAGTSPSIAALPGGGFEVAFQANTSDLWTVGSAGNKDWKLGMRTGTSPSITALPDGGFEVAFQANTSDLWTVGNAGNTDWKLGMMADTSPSIAALSGGGFEVAFQANTGDLWTVGNAGNKDWKLGMMAGTSPSIARRTGGFEVAFQANTSDLWTVGSTGDTDWKLGMMAGSGPGGS